MTAPRTGSVTARGQRLMLALAVAAFFAFIAGASVGATNSGSIPYLHRLGPFRPTLAQVQTRALKRVLSYTAYLSKGTPRKREVALTFDDGPGPFTQEVVRILRNTKTPATFFAVGSQYQSFSAAGQAEAVDGFPVGNHTQDHRAMGSISVPDQEAQLDEGAMSMSHAGLPKPTLFRPPYGSYSQSTLDLLKRKGLLMVIWSIDSEDWTMPGVDRIVQNVLGSIGPGDVVLMHDAGGDRSQTIAALPQILAGLKRRHLKPVTVPQLLVDDPPPRNQGDPTIQGAG